MITWGGDAWALGWMGGPDDFVVRDHGMLDRSRFDRDLGPFRLVWQGESAR